MPGKAWFQGKQNTNIGQYLTRFDIKHFLLLVLGKTNLLIKPVRFPADHVAAHPRFRIVYFPRKASSGSMVAIRNLYSVLVSSPGTYWFGIGTEVGKGLKVV